MRVCADCKATSRENIIKSMIYTFLIRLALTKMRGSFLFQPTFFILGIGGFVLGSLAIAVPAGFNGGDGQTIQVFGTYTGRDQDPNTGQGLVNEMHTFNAAFHIIVTGDAWVITSTNLSDIDVPAVDWHLAKGSVVQVWCDGTNTYSLQPENNDSKLSSYATNLVTVEKSRFYTASYGDDVLGLSLPWLTYCFAPDQCQPGLRGVFSLPVPWLQPRFSLVGYGFKWVIAGTKEGRYLKSMKLVRESSLDLSDKGALLRTNFVYPSSAASYERILRQLANNRAIPDGWVQAEFTCVEEYHTNGLALPARSVIKMFTFNPTIANPYPYYVGELRLLNVIIGGTSAEFMLPNVTKPTRVSDFRYRRSNADRIYRLAEYTLNPGDVWKAGDDRALMAEVEDYLKHGPSYEAFLNNRRHKLFLVWLTLGLVSLIPLLAILKKQSKT